MGKENLLATQAVRGLTPYQPGKPMDELERELGIDDIVKLASNENPMGSGPAASAAAREALSQLGRYPDGNGFSLKKALADRLGVAQDQLTLGNGSNDILELITRAYVTTEHEIVFSQHAFAVYPLVTQAVGAKAVVVPAKDFGHDLGEMAASITNKSRMVFIANPNNPTGTWVDATALRKFMESTPEHVIIVVDEAYFDYVSEPTYPNCLAYLDEFPNLVVTRTFSKAYGLAALRVGFSVSHPQVADFMNRVRQPFNVNAVALAAAAAALADTDHLQQSVRMNAVGMETLTRAFSDLGLPFIPSVGNFVCVEVGDAAGEVYQRMLAQGVIVRPVANYGLPRHLRMTIGTESENQRCIAALKSALVD